MWGLIGIPVGIIGWLLVILGLVLSGLFISHIIQLFAVGGAGEFFAGIVFGFICLGLGIAFGPQLIAAMSKGG